MNLQKKFATSELSRHLHYGKATERLPQLGCLEGIRSDVGAIWCREGRGDFFRKTVFPVPDRQQIHFNFGKVC